MSPLADRGPGIHVQVELVDDQGLLFPEFWSIDQVKVADLTNPFAVARPAPRNRGDQHGLTSVIARELKRVFKTSWARANLELSMNFASYVCA